MHPAYSVIVFTTCSGAGYGMLFWLSLAHLLGALPGGRGLALVVLTIALGLVSIGLLASTLHLGHPERAFRAFSQWRSSWLSREGVVAVATYVPAGLLWLLWVLGLTPDITPFLGMLAALGAVATVYCTGMIYASLRTIRQWNRNDVPLVYLALAAGTGGLLLSLCLALAGGGTWAAGAGLVGLAVAAVLKWRYWAAIDADPGHYTAEMAIGLGNLGAVRPLDPPHTMANYVMREMGYSVARKHAVKLRKLVLASLFALPLLLILLSLILPLSALWLGLASLSAGLGVATERWLFFAEAEHVSQLYYGQQRA